MKKIYILFIIFSFIILPSFATDEVHANGSSLSGRIQAVTDGLIQISSGGVDYSVVRSKKDDFFGDYISYRKYPILGGYEKTACRIIYVDRFYVIFKTENSKIQVPRYGVTDMVLDAN